MLAVYLFPLYVLVNLYVFRWGIRYMSACSRHFKKKWVRSDRGCGAIDLEADEVDQSGEASFQKDICVHRDVLRSCNCGSCCKRCTSWITNHRNFRNWRMLAWT